MKEIQLFLRLKGPTGAWSQETRNEHYKGIMLGSKQFYWLITVRE